MLDFTDFAAVAGMMFLRIGVPLLIVLAFGYGLKRLDRRWEAEAREYQAKFAGEQPAIQPEKPAQQPALPATARKSGKRPAAPQPLPFVPPAVAQKGRQVGQSAELRMAAPVQHCWDSKTCSESTRAACAASTHPEQPCWQARFNAEGHIPEECVHCDVFQRYPTM